MLENRVVPAAKTRQVVAIIVKRGQQVLVEKVAPMLRVVREPNKAPRVEVTDVRD